MIVKDNSVKLEGIQPIMRHAMKWADWIWKDLGQECVITAGTEATKDGDLIHSAGSLHYSGLALDFRTRYFADKGDKAAYELEKALNDVNRGLDSGQFEVIQHKTHIHVEFEPNE
jgi:pantothenate synthetase